MKNKKLLIKYFLFVSVGYFLLNHLLQFVLSKAGQETLLTEIIFAVSVGALTSLGFWNLHNKSRPR